MGDCCTLEGINALLGVGGGGGYIIVLDDVTCDEGKLYVGYTSAT